MNFGVAVLDILDIHRQKVLIHRHEYFVFEKSQFRFLTIMHLELRRETHHQ